MSNDKLIIENARALTVTRAFDHKLKKNLIYCFRMRNQEQKQLIIGNTWRITVHDKIIISDNQTVESGSYNYTSAATRNSENALVLHDVPELAQTYLTHWQSRWDMGTDWQSSY